MPADSTPSLNMAPAGPPTSVSGTPGGSVGKRTVPSEFTGAFSTTVSGVTRMALLEGRTPVTFTVAIATAKPWVASTVNVRAKSTGIGGTVSKPPGDMLNPIAPSDGTIDQVIGKPRLSVAPNWIGLKSVGTRWPEPTSETGG